MTKDPFKEYIIAGEPNKRELSCHWANAIGLQAVDGLKPSQYLIDTAIRNIEGEITIHEVQDIIDKYYKTNPITDPDDRTEEADKVSARITLILCEHAFTCSPTEYMAIHRRLFTGIYKHAGAFRDYNITKKEWVLDGATVMYGSATELKATLDYDFAQERAFNYANLNVDETIHHIAQFISRLWQIHVFGEGNTRTTAVFLVKYLRSMGFDATNDTFAENAWYFRNALVRANYSDVKAGIHETTIYLERIIRNNILKENNTLKNRVMHISGFFKEDEKPDIGDKKPDIGDEKPDIEGKKSDIDMVHALDAALLEYSITTRAHAIRLYQKYGTETFGRSMVVDELSLSASAASDLLAKLVHANVITPVTGQGKGKYKFIE